MPGESGKSRAYRRLSRRDKQWLVYRGSQRMMGVQLCFYKWLLQACFRGISCSRRGMLTFWLVRDTTRKYPHDNHGRGDRSVDEVSELLGIPRPTLYRYLREYSIPNVRKSGRISIPEGSVEQIRRVRDLHREGMGTGSVRRVLREGEVRTSGGSDLALRLEKLSGELEGLRSESSRVAEDLSSSQALRTVLARQSVLISAVFNLTEMVEELLRATGQHSRRTPFDVVEGEAGSDYMELRLLEGGALGSRGRLPDGPPEARLARSPAGRGASRGGAAPRVSSRSGGYSAIRLSASSDSSRPRSGRAVTGDGFGALSRRRRRTFSISLGFAAALVAAALLIYALGTF